MEVTRKSEVREFKPASMRSEIPPNYFQVPCRDIAQVMPSASGNEYHIRDSRGREIPKLSRAVYGDFKGNGSDFLVFKKGSIYQICDSRGRSGVSKETLSCGEFRGISGQYVVFEKGNNLYTYDKSFRQVGNPQRKLS